MPVITFIIQRLALGVLAGMTFLGLVSEDTYFATESAFIVPQERKEAIVESLSDPETIVVFEDLNENKKLDVAPVPRMSDKDKGDTRLEDELVNIIEHALPQEVEDLFVLPAETVRKEAETQEVIIPDELTEEPIPEQVFREEQREVLQETLNTIEERLDTIKREQAQQEPVVVPTPVVEAVTIPNTLTNAVVNIVCLEKKGNILNVAVGSGVFVGQDGSIITNGHVAQHILKQKSEFVDCEVKHPDNPSMRYRVAVVHIPDMWRGGSLINESHGTGENDFAFLSVVGPAPGGIIPTSFPYLRTQTSKSVLSEGNDIFLAGYPAVQTGNIQNDTNAPLITDQSVIEDVFTFGIDSIDVVASGVSPVARQGASGGAVVDDGKLIGIIVTTNEYPSGGTYLNGLTLNYIQRELQSQGLSLQTFL